MMEAGQPTETNAVEESDMPSYCPRVREGLIYAQTAPDRYVVKDPDSGSYFGVSAETACIIQYLDGTRDVEAVSSQLKLRLEVVRYVIRQLASLHLLEVEATGERITGQEKPQSWVQRVLLVRKDLITSPSWMASTYRLLRLRILFQPWCGAFLLVLLLATFFVWLLYSAVMQQGLRLLFRPGIELAGTIALGLVFYLVISLLHELAHGFACTHFGGKVRSVGIGLYYFQPIWYCDVSDAWLFPKRSQRLVTHAAGLMLNFVLAALAVLLLPLATHISWLLEPLALTFLISGMYALANLNPLIQLDGYYLLADALHIENLRTNALGTLYSGMRRALYRVGVLKRPPAARRRRTLWERRILVCYALLSLCYTILLSWYLSAYYASFLAAFSSVGRWLFFGVFLTLFTLIPFWKGLKGSAKVALSRRVR